MVEGGCQDDIFSKDPHLTIIGQIGEDDGSAIFCFEKLPNAAETHPELGDGPLLSPEDHSKFGSPVKCANWLVTLGGFDVACAVNANSRFSMAP